MLGPLDAHMGCHPAKVAHTHRGGPPPLVDVAGNHVLHRQLDARHRARGMPWLRLARVVLQRSRAVLGLRR